MYKGFKPALASIYPDFVQSSTQPSISGKSNLSACLRAFEARKFENRPMWADPSTRGLWTQFFSLYIISTNTNCYKFAASAPTNQEICDQRLFLDRFAHDNGFNATYNAENWYDFIAKDIISAVCSSFFFSNKNCIAPIYRKFPNWNQFLFKICVSNISFWADYIEWWRKNEIWSIKTSC